MKDLIWMWLLDIANDKTGMRNKSRTSPDTISRPSTTRTEIGTRNMTARDQLTIRVLRTRGNGLEILDRRGAASTVSPAFSKRKRTRGRALTVGE